MQQSRNAPEMVTPSKDDTQPTLSHVVSLKNRPIIPLPKMKVKTKRSGKGLKSVLLMSSPNNERMENKAKEKQKLATEKEKVPKKQKNVP